jgi:DNA repair exonuclease SbcCD ATPase subunit
MSNIKNELHEKQKRVEKLRETINERTRTFGKQNLELPVPGEAGAFELKQRALSLLTELTKVEESSEKIRSLLAASDNAENRLEELEAAEKDIREKKERAGTDCARICLELFLSGKLGKERFAPLFAELLENREKEKKVTAELSVLEEARERSPLLKKIPYGAKISLSRNTLSGIRKEQETLLRKAGTAFFEQKYDKNFEDPAITPLVAVFRENERRNRDIDKERKNLQAELQKTAVELEALDADRNSGKRLRELDRQKDELLTKIAEAQGDYGAALLIMPELRELAQKKGEASLLEEISALEAEQEELKDCIAALQYGIEAEEKQNELEKERALLEKLNKKRQELDTEIKELKRTISEDEKELARLEEAAGQKA